ncbi:MAG: aminotransferase class I/II-fold pyridoxal phosphate-dependent enzyme [Deltaproteobacteria bacterium]|nr:MAG: aminotransferase class I/II-fold pyridoxal phosphate-dependent enzyme [Deltaproteobacteria bacterium]
MGSMERSLLLDAFDSNWIAPLGPHLDAFEREFCETVGVGHAVALSSGTAGLHLALLLLGVGAGDEVLVSSFTFAATANAVTYTGAFPVFIDSDHITWNMDPGLLEEELKACAKSGKLPKAVIVVDLYGQCADYKQIIEMCTRYEVPVVEDAAEALGASYRGKPAGSFASMAVFSFNGNKIITTSGGGMLVSNDAGFIEKARYLATQARDPAPHYQHSVLGYNYRMSNLLAAVGRGQLTVLQDRVFRKREINQYYQNALGDLPGISFMPEAPYGVSNRWLTCVQIDPDRFGATRKDIRLQLEQENIESRPVWMPMHLQPVFSGCRVRGGSVSAEIFKKGLCLPSGTNLNEVDLDRIVRIVRSACIDPAR